MVECLPRDHNTKPELYSELYSSVERATIAAKRSTVGDRKCFLQDPNTALQAGPLLERPAGKLSAPGLSRNKPKARLKFSKI